MKLPIKLSKYIGGNFLVSIGIIFFVLSLVVILFEALEIFRRASVKDIPFGVIIEMVILKTPNTLQKIMPFAVMIGSIMSFVKLTSNSELVAVRAAGISAWQFLMPAIIISFLIGVFFITIFNPLSAVMLARFEQIEAKNFSGSTSMLSVSSSGLWLRQKNQFDEGKTIFHALRVSQEDMKLFDVTIYQFFENNKFNKRIDAESAILRDGYWQIKNANISSIGVPKKSFDVYEISTDLKIQRIQDSFAAPETISFWQLPSFISNLKKAGFSALRHRMHWHSVLVLPFFLCAMVYIAAAFSLRPPRQGKTGMLIIGGLFSSLLIYFLPQLVAAYGLSGTIPIPLAAWVPICIGLAIGTFLMLHLEDG